MKPPHPARPHHHKPTVFDGTFEPEELERLEDGSRQRRRRAALPVTASLDRQRRKVVSCIIEGFVFLLCQKTLGSVSGTRSRSRQAGPRRRRGAASGDRGGERRRKITWSRTSPLDIRDLVEDAVLLALPMVPRKPGWRRRRAGDGGAAPKESPFAALASLKKMILDDPGENSWPSNRTRSRRPSAACTGRTTT